MAELVREGAERPGRAVEAHDDERVRPRSAGREGAAPLALVRVDVDPPLFQTAAPHGLDVLVAERCEGLADPVHALLVRQLLPRPAERRPEVVRTQRVDAEQRFTHPPVAMPRRQVPLEGRKEVVEHLDRDVRAVKGGSAGGCVPARAGREDVLLNRGRVVRGEDVPERAIAIREALPGALAQRSVGASEQAPHRALGHVNGLARTARRRGENQISVREARIHRIRARMGVGDQAEQLLDLRRADVLAAAEEVVEEVAVLDQLVVGLRPLAEAIASEFEELGFDECRRGGDLGVEPAGAAAPRDRIRVGRLHRVADARVHEDGSDAPLERVAPRKRLDRHLCALAQPALERLQGGELRRDRPHLRLPVGDRGEHALGVPGPLGGELAPGRSAQLVGAGAHRGLPERSGRIRTGCGRPLTTSPSGSITPPGAPDQATSKPARTRVEDMTSSRGAVRCRVLTVCLGTVASARILARRRHLRTHVSGSDTSAAARAALPGRYRRLPEPGARGSRLAVELLPGLRQRSCVSDGSGSTSARS